MKNKNILLTSIFLLTSLFGNENGLEILKLKQSWFSSIAKAQEESREVFAWFSKIPDPAFNEVLCFHHREGIEAHLNALLDALPKDLPVSFWINPSDTSQKLREVLAGQRFVSEGCFAAMSWKVHPIDIPLLEICPAFSDELFHEILAGVFQYGQEIKQARFNLLAATEGERYIVYLDGKPVGTGMLLLQGNIGGLFHIGVLPEYQRKGIGTAMVQFLMHRANFLGLEKLVLHASPIGEILYRKLGFERVDEIEIYSR